MKFLKYLIILCLLSLVAPTLLSAEPIDKMSDIELFERALIQIELHKNYQKHRRQVFEVYGRRSGFPQNPKYRRWPDLYTNYSAYRNEIIKRASSKKTRGTEFILKNYLNIKDDFRVTVLATAMLDRNKNPEKYKRLDGLRKKMLDNAAPLAVSPWRNLTQQARALVNGYYDKNPYESNSSMGGFGEFAPPAKSKAKDHPAKEFMKNTSIVFLCEMTLTNKDAFKGYSLIVLGQFKNSPLAVKTLKYTFGDFDEGVRGAALEGIALTGDMETVRKALKDDSEYIRKLAAKLLLQEKDKKQQGEQPTSANPKIHNRSTLQKG